MLDNLIVTEMIAISVTLTIYTVSQKRYPDIIDCNFKKD